MPDLPDYRTPSPDLGHEAIRAPLAEAIDRLGSAFQLLQSTVDFAQSTLHTVTAGQEAIAGMQSGLATLGTLVQAVLIRERTHADCIDALEVAVANLTKRIAALEPTPEPNPAPTPDEPASDAPPTDLTNAEETPCSAPS